MVATTTASSLLVSFAASAALFYPINNNAGTVTALFVPSITTSRRNTSQQRTSIRGDHDDKSYYPQLLWGVAVPPRRERSTLMMSSTDHHHQQEQQQPSLLFDALELFDDPKNNDDDAETLSFFEDVESEFDTLEQKSQHTSSTSDDSIEYAYTDNALTDEEARILTDREERLFQYINNTQKVESCILIGVEDLSAQRKANKALRMQQKEDGDLAATPTTTNVDDISLSWTLEESLTEMRELIKTAGLNLEGEITQRLQEVNPKTYIGTGKVKEAQQLLDEINEKLERRNEGGTCCTVVFDAELTPGQQKALENAFNKKVIDNDFLGSDNDEVVKVVDRTALILDIFAQHAKTREGKLQVDLALHEYRKPRLTRMWTHLERQSGAGGVGLRGPGETQLEVDKRILRDRILVLKEKIDDVQKQRDLHRRGRKKGGLPVLALVGYTNAGKSTLLNCLTRAGILAENILFATLDPTTRRVKLPGYKTHPEVLLTDTVGFIQKLPTQLVAAFRATLEEVKEADVLVHIVDVSNPCWRKQEVSVTNVLEEIGAADSKCAANNVMYRCLFCCCLLICVTELISFFRAHCSCIQQTRLTRFRRCGNVEVRSSLF